MIHFEEEMFAPGPQKVNSGKGPSSATSWSCSDGGQVQQSGSLRPSAWYSGRGVIVVSTSAPIAYHQHTLATLSSGRWRRIVSHARTTRSPTCAELGIANV